MSNYTPVIHRTHPGGEGTQRIYRFPNGYGASVIQSPYSYGGRDGLYELAVAKFNGEDHDDWSLCYETEITDDVLGYLTEREVREALDKIAGLPNA